MQRKAEYFGSVNYGAGSETIMSSIREVFPQERDWTCSVASIRTLLSGSKNCDIPTEDWFVSTYKLEKGPYNSKQILDKGLVSSYDYKLGCTEPILEGNQLFKLTQLMKTHNVMIECLINYAHWIVLLGYVKLGTIEQDKFIYYDPYYHRIQTIIADELMSMWYDISGTMHRDYIAIAK